MSTTRKEYFRQYHINLKLELLNRYGNICNRCLGNKCCNIELQFAHVKPTKLSGMSRGKRNRLSDIKNNPDCYILMGKTCHREYDTNVYITRSI